MATAHYFLVRRPHLIPAAIATVVLLGAICTWPYAYYQIMRWVVCAAAVFTAYQGYATRHLWGAWAFGLVAVLFNPIAPIHLTRHAWQVLDPAAALLFLAGIVLISRPVKNERHTQKESD
jgi:hypothetical protein